MIYMKMTFSSLLSCAQEKSDVEAAAATPALAKARETVIALAEQAGKVQQQCGLDILPAEYARNVLKWGLMEVRPTFDSVLIVKQSSPTKFLMISIMQLCARCPEMGATTFLTSNSQVCAERPETGPHGGDNRFQQCLDCVAVVQVCAECLKMGKQVTQWL